MHTPLRPSIGTDKSVPLQGIESFHADALPKALSVSQARTYHAREFASERQNYWSRDQQGFSEWQACGEVGPLRFRGQRAFRTS